MLLVAYVVEQFYNFVSHHATITNYGTFKDTGHKKKKCGEN